MIIATQAQTIIQPPPNLLTNGNMDIWQRGTSFTSSTWRTNENGKCCVDRWKLMYDTTNVVSLSQSTDVPTGQGYQYSLLSTVVTANKKFAHIQYIPNTEAVKLAGRYVSIGFWAKTATSHAMSNVRAAVFSWTGTADTGISTVPGNATSSVFNAWSAAGTNPTQGSSWTMENTATNLPLTTSWSHYTINNIYVDTASLTNLAVAIWCDDTTNAAGNLLYITGIDLVDNATWIQTAKRSFVDELNKCNYHFYKSYPYAIVPGTAGGAATSNNPPAFMTPTTYIYQGLQTPIPSMFSTPTKACWSPKTGFANNFCNNGGTDIAATIDSGLLIYTNNVSVPNGSMLYIHFTAEAEL